MNRFIRSGAITRMGGVLTGLLLAALIQGCAAVVVGGAATAIVVSEDRRTAGTIVEDKNIELKALDLLRNDRLLKSLDSNISATSYNLVVLLTGEVPSEAARRRAGELMKGIPRVKRVVNELQVGSNASLGERSHDAALTAEIKLRLNSIDLPEFNPVKVKVITMRGVVYLMGLVTHQEADAVTEVARRVSGVRRVVRVFEYF